MISVDELVLEMRDIMELSYVFYSEKDEELLSIIYGLLKRRLQRFYRDCFLANRDILEDSLFYAVSLIKAYQDDEVLKNMAIRLKEYVVIVKNDLYINEMKTVVKK